MTNSIGSNVQSLKTRTQLNKVENKQLKVFAQLASGQRDLEAASQAISDALGAGIAQNNAAVRNISDGVSAAQIAESAAGEAQKLLERNRELEIQSGSGQYNDAQRAILDVEYQENLKEIDRIAQVTEFNGTKLLSNGTGETQQSVAIQADRTTDGSGVLYLPTGDIQSSGGNIRSVAAARTALEDTSTSDDINKFRSAVGAFQARGEAATNLLHARTEAETRAQAAITDADIGKLTSEKAANDILLRAATETLNQSNNLPRLALSLIA